MIKRKYIILLIIFGFHIIGLQTNQRKLTEFHNETLFKYSDTDQSEHLYFTYPNNGETISGSVTITWHLLAIYSINVSFYNLFYSPNDGTNWIQLAFGVVDEHFYWDTTLFEDYGKDFILKVTATSKAWEEKEAITEQPFTIDNRADNPDIITPFLIMAAMTIIVGTIYTLYQNRFKTITFMSLVSTNRLEYLRILKNKVIIGLDNISSEYSSKSTKLIETESLKLKKESIINYFPSIIQEELKSDIKGRTVLALIEIAYQNPKETNPVKLARELKIPLSTLSKEIKKLVTLNYVEYYVSEQVLYDGRYRNFKITEKGYDFLYILNDVLKDTIQRLNRS